MTSSGKASTSQIMEILLPMTLAIFLGELLHTGESENIRCERESEEKQACHCRRHMELAAAERRAKNRKAWHGLIGLTCMNCLLEVHCLLLSFLINLHLIFNLNLLLVAMPTLFEAWQV